MLFHLQRSYLREPLPRLLAVHILQNSDTEEEIKNKLQSVESGLKTSFGSGLKCESSLAHGNIVTALKKIIEAEQADLIVMGTKGASGLKKILIGSNTLKVIAKIKVPVLVIPKVAQFENFLNKGKNRIVLATDLISLENEDALNILKEIALLIIEPKVRVLSVRPKNTSLPHLKRAERNFLLSLFNPEIESESITVFSDNVISGINFYLNKKDGHRACSNDCPRFSATYSKALYQRNGFLYTFALVGFA